MTPSPTYPAIFRPGPHPMKGDAILSGFVIGDRGLGASGDTHPPWMMAYAVAGPYLVLGASAVGQIRLSENAPRNDAFVVRPAGPGWRWLWRTGSVRGPTLAMGPPTPLKRSPHCCCAPQPVRSASQRGVPHSTIAPRFRYPGATRQSG